MIGKFLATMALVAATVLPAQADILIDQLMIRRTGEAVNIRVTVRNPAPQRQPGPVLISLFVRHKESDDWIEVQTWNDIAYVAPGYKVSRDFFDENSPTLQALALKTRFQVKATISAPGLTENVEQTSWYDDADPEQ